MMIPKILVDLCEMSQIPCTAPKDLPATSPPIWWQFASDALIALGTVAVAVLAIWGQWFRSKLAGSSLLIEQYNFRGTLTNMNNGKRGIYYHLVVRNMRKWSPAQNCRVMLRALERRGTDGQYHPERLSVPLQFVWAPAGFTPVSPTIVDEQVLDLGFVVENGQNFTPAFYVTTVDFKGYVSANDSVRYHLQVISDDFASKKFIVIEVSWNGNWSDNLDKMEKNLIIKVVSS